LESKLSENHSSVGYFVQFTHKTCSRLDARLRIEAKVTKADSRRTTFDIAIQDEANGSERTGFSFPVSAASLALTAN
jgi:predicted thioesterase